MGSEVVTNRSISNQEAINFNTLNNQLNCLLSVKYLNLKKHKSDLNKWDGSGEWRIGSRRDPLS